MITLLAYILLSTNYYMAAETSRAKYIIYLTDYNSTNEKLERKSVADTFSFGDRTCQFSVVTENKDTILFACDSNPNLENGNLIPHEKSNIVLYTLNECKDKTLFRMMHKNETKHQSIRVECKKKDIEL